MKTVKQILEQVNYKNDDNSIVSGLSQLAESGLFEESKLNMIKRSLTKENVNEMTEAERKTLQEALNILVNNLTEADHLSAFDKRHPQGYPSDKDMPTVIILKRKAIRVYPDNQKVALYYSQALDKYVSVPFGNKKEPLGLTLNESEDRIPISDVITTQNISPEKLEKVWRKAGNTDKGRREIAGRLGPKERNMVQGGNRKAIAYGFEHGNFAQALGITAGVGIRAAFEKVRGTRAMKRPEMKGSVPSVSSKSSNSLSEPGKETPWGATQTQSSQSTRTNTPPQASSVKPTKQNVPVSQRSGAVAARDMKNRSIKESFRQKLEEKRDGKIEEEGAWDATKAFARNAASSATFGLSDAIGKKVSSDWAKEGERLSAEHPIASTAGDIAGYAVPGLAALKGAKLAYGGAKAVLGGTKVGRGLARASRAVKGAASLGAGALSAIGRAGGGSGQGSADFEPTGGTYQFGNIKGITVGGPGDRSTLDLSTGKGLVDKSFMMQREEYSNFNKIRIISENKDMESELVFEDSSVTVNNRIAKKIMNLHESLNKRNKKKVEKMVNEDIASLRKVINFAVRQ